MKSKRNQESCRKKVRLQSLLKDAELFQSVRQATPIAMALTVKTRTVEKSFSTKVPTIFTVRTKFH